METIAKAESSAPSHKKRGARKRIKRANETKEILLNRAGDWMPAGSLRIELIQAIETGTKVVLNLGELDYVDAASLQVLLAAGMAGGLAPGKMCLLNVSDEVKRCFTYAGAETLLFADAEGRS